MPRRAFRAAHFAIVTVALWSPARPAYAMTAPLCDDRGATTMAPPPTLQAPDAVIAPSASARACGRDEALPGDAAAPGQGPSIAPASQGDQAVIAAPLVVPPPPAALGAPRARDLVWVDPGGARSRVERPP